MVQDVSCADMNFFFSRTLKLKNINTHTCTSKESNRKQKSKFFYPKPFSSFASRISVTSAVSSNCLYISLKSNAVNNNQKGLQSNIIVD